MLAIIQFSQVLVLLFLFRVTAFGFVVEAAQSGSIATISHTVEFQLLDYINYEGRLLSGDCCSGYKSALGRGLCRGGNSTCAPFWKICLTQQPLDNEALVMPTQRRTDTSRSSKSSSLSLDFNWSYSNKNRRTYLGREGSSISSTTSSTTTTTPAPANSTSSGRPSIFKSFLNRILGGLKTIQSLTDYAAGSDKQGQNQSSSCSIAYWTTDVVPVLNSSDPVTLRASIPKTVMSRYRKLEGAKLRKAGLTRDQIEKAIQQKVLVFVEIWHKHSIIAQSGEPVVADKLIARHLEQKVTTVQLPTPEAENYWETGGQSIASNGSNGVEFRYRWRLLGEYETQEPVETTTTIVCPDGYQGPECKSPICSEGCDVSHGYCEKPDDCKCKFGWTGEYCSLCMPMPGCVHGSCIKPFECRCEEGWSGMFCDKPSCKIGCHPQNGYCEQPGECRCRFGYQGDNCTDCATMPGCQHGTCSQPLDCNCDAGWKGMFCSIPMCSTGCDLDHGWCRRPDECRCRVGWTGRNCSECVPYPGCNLEHGSCSDPWTCDCEPGWGGTTCDERLDYCETVEANPCQNGGQCISTERADGGYLCQCPQNYEGRNCERIKPGIN